MPLIEKHMDLLTKENLQPLLQDHASMCASIYMPTVRRGKETQQNPVRLKNLIRQAETRLQECGLKAADASELTRPAKELLDDSVFWSHQSDGLAVFLGPDSAYAYRLPLEFDEIVDCGEHFLIKPLLPMLGGDGRYYILVLSKGSVKLLQCSRFTVGEVDLGPEAPKNVDDILKYFDFEESLQWRQSTIASVPGRGDAGAIYHGHGSQADAANMKERVASFLKRLDDAVRGRLNGEKAPMVLAGVESIRAMYRDVSHYAPILQKGIEGNLEQKHDEDLARKAWDIVAPEFEQGRRRDFERLQQLLGSGGGKATRSLPEVVAGAWARRVETLFVPMEPALWGKFDPQSMNIQTREQPRQGDQDLLNDAAVYTLRGGGAIYGCAAADLPDKAPVAAIFW